MAAPVAAYVRLPDDSANAGKKVRTQSRVVGADTVHEHFFIPTSKDSKVGLYRAHSGTLTIPTSAHNGTTTGHLWFSNPTGSATKARLRRIFDVVQFVAGAIDLTVPRSLYSLFTFTGTASGTTITPAKRDSTDAAPNCTLRTASTGMTVTLGQTFRGTTVPAVNATASSATVQVNLMPCIFPVWDPEEEEGLVIRAGEGVVLWAGDASTTANRRLFSDLAWEEFE